MPKKLREKIQKIKMPRMTWWMLVTAAMVLLIYHLTPQNVPVLLYNTAQLTLGGILGYRLDVGIFPYSRPGEVKNLRGSLADDDGVLHYYAMCMLRRAIIVAACVIAIALGV